MGAPRASPESSITICIGERELARFLCLSHHQGRIKGGGNGGNCPGHPAEIDLFQIKYLFEKFRDCEAIQEYNPILYSYVALSIRAHNSN